MSRWQDGGWPSAQAGSHTWENQVDRENKVLLEAWAVGGSNDDHLLGQARSHAAAGGLDLVWDEGARPEFRQL